MSVITVKDYFFDKAMSGKFPGPIVIEGVEYFIYGKEPGAWIQFDCGLEEDQYYSPEEIAKNTLLTEEELLIIGSFNRKYDKEVFKYICPSRRGYYHKELIEYIVKYKAYGNFLTYLQENGMTGDEPVFPA